jgi:hypothetical protein
MRQQCKEAECKAEDALVHAEKVHSKLYQEVQEHKAQLAGVRSENKQLKGSLASAQVKLLEPCSPACSSPPLPLNVACLVLPHRLQLTAWSKTWT